MRAAIHTVGLGYPCSLLQLHYGDSPYDQRHRYLTTRFFPRYNQPLRNTNITQVVRRQVKSIQLPEVSSSDRGSYVGSEEFWFADAADVVGGGG